MQPIGRFHVGPSWTLHEVGRPHRPPCRAAAGGDRRLFWLMALGPRAVSLYCRSWKSGASPHWIFRFSRVRPRVAGPVWGRLIAHLKHTALVDRVRSAYGRGLVKLRRYRRLIWPAIEASSTHTRSRHLKCTRQIPKNNSETQATPSPVHAMFAVSKPTESLHKWQPHGRNF